MLLFNLSVALRKLGRWAEAEGLVPAIREVVGNEELDLTRTLWNEGLIDTGLGRVARSTTALEQVFNDLVALGLPYDAALAGMDLAAVHLDQGHTREVMFLAGRMEAVFRTFNIEREALAALRIRGRAMTGSFRGKTLRAASIGRAGRFPLVPWCILLA